MEGYGGKVLIYRTAGGPLEQPGDSKIVLLNEVVDLQPRSAVAVLPDPPDDEISISAWIRRLARNGNHVYLSWTHSVSYREAEARAAALLLEIPQDRLFFDGAADGHVCMEMRALVPKFAEMVEEVRPHRICCGAFEHMIFITMRPILC